MLNGIAALDSVSSLAAFAWEEEFPAMIETIIYFVLAMVLFGVAVVACDKLAPFSVRKEIEEDQNTALAILMGSGLIAVSIIIAAVVK